MIRFAVLLLFFIHLAILLALPRLKWLSLLLGYGISAVFFALYAFQVKENSDIVFLVMAIMATGSMAAAEIVAFFLRRLSFHRG